MEGKNLILSLMQTIKVDCGKVLEWIVAIFKRGLLQG